MGDVRWTQWGAGRLKRDAVARKHDPPPHRFQIFEISSSGKPGREGTKNMTRAKCWMGLLLAWETAFVCMSSARGGAWGWETVNGVEWTYMWDSKSKTATVTSANPISGSVVIPDSLGGCLVTSFRPDGAFHNCMTLTSLTIPDSVTSIDTEWAFEGCSNLVHVTLSDGLKAIPVGCFSFCFQDDSNPASIVIGNNVKTIGQYAFQACRGLTSVKLSANLTNIGLRAFSSCSGLTSVTIPDSVVNLGAEAFSKCSGLKSATIGNGITNIPSSLFIGCNNLVSMEIPDSVTSIERSAFSRCSMLESVTFGNSVTNIGSLVFYESGLMSVAIPDGVTIIAEETFSRCQRLKSIAFGSGVTNIGNNAFLGCTNLTRITIPANVTYIGGAAFCNCSNLTSVCFNGGVPSGGDKAFFGVASGARGYYTAAHRAEWKAVIDADGKWQGLIMCEISPPVLTVAGAEPMKRSLKLSWKDAMGVEGVTYSIYRGAGEDRASADLVAPSVTGNTWEDKSFWTAGPALKPLNYWVVANDSGGGERESSPVKTRRRFGVFVGLSEFHPKLKTETLSAPAKEALKLRDLFVQYGEMDDENAIPLTNANAKWEDVQRELRTKVLEAQPGDLFVFYIATHGVIDRGGVQNWMGLEYYDKNVFFGEVFKELGKFNSGVVVIPIFGTCHSGVFTDYASGAAELNETSLIFKQFVEAGLGMCRANMPILAACGQEETSPARGTDENYTGFGESFIFQGWENGYADGEVSGVGYDRGPGDGCGDGYVSFLELIRYAKAFARGSSDAKRSHVQWSTEPLEYEWLLRDTLAGKVPTGGNHPGVPGTPSLSWVSQWPEYNKDWMAVVMQGTSVANATKYWCYVLKDGKTVNSANEDDWECVNYWGQQNEETPSQFLGWHNAVVLGKTDWYRVRAVNGAGASDFSNIVELNNGNIMDSVEMSVTGPGILQFRWKALREGVGEGHGDCEAEFLVNDVRQVGLDRVETWKTEGIFPFARNSEYRLQWVRSSYNPIWIDQLKWTPTESVTVNGRGWQYTEDGDKAMVMCGESEGNVDIPSELGGATVTAIGEGAFCGQTGLASVAIPGSVEYIGNGAFAGCTGLTSVVIPSSVTFVGRQVFEGCDHLAALYVPAEWEGTDMLAGVGVPDGCKVFYGTPNSEATMTTPVAVPHEWLDGKATGILEEKGGDYEAAAGATASNGMAVWECYLAGLSTTNAAAEFKVKSIEFEGEKPVVKWEPDLNVDGTTNRVYRVWARKSVEKAEGEEEVVTKDGWRDVTGEDERWVEDGWRVFRVEVGMPE